MGILKILFYFILTVVIFNLVRVAVFMKKALSGTGKGMKNGNRGSQAENSKKSENKNSVIELDKDQYHVE